MQVSIETTSGLERRMTVGVPASVIDNAVNARLEEASRTVRLNGFRKGRIPLSVIKGKFGKGVRQEVLGEVMSKSYYDAIAQQQLRPAGQPRIEAKTLEEGKDLEFTAVFEIYPDVKPADFGNIKVDRLDAQVADENIDKMVETLRQQRQTWEKVQRQSKNGDTLNIDYRGTIAGEDFAGGSGTGTNLILGSERMILGFEKGLLKKKAGDTVTLDLNFPEDYRNKDLAGKPVKFEITVNSVSTALLPELNDEFFAVFGVEEGGEQAFRKEVAANMDRELKTASKTKIKSQVMDALLVQNQLDLPGSLVISEIAVLRQQALQQFGGKNIDPALLPDELFRGQAERRVGLGLILGEVIRLNHLRADPAKVRSMIEDIAATYESPDEVIAWYYSNEDQLTSVQSAALEDQAFDFILSKAKVNERTVSYDELIKPDNAAAKETAQPKAKAKAKAKAKPDADKA